MSSINRNSAVFTISGDNIHADLRTESLRNEGARMNEEVMREHMERARAPQSWFRRQFDNLMRTLTCGGNQAPQAQTDWFMHKFESQAVHEAQEPMYHLSSASICCGVRLAFDPTTAYHYFDGLLDEKELDRSRSTRQSLEEEVCQLQEAIEIIKHRFDAFLGDYATTKETVGNMWNQQHNDQQPIDDEVASQTVYSRTYAIDEVYVRHDMPPELPAKAKELRERELARKAQEEHAFVRANTVPPTKKRVKY